MRDVDVDRSQREAGAIRRQAEIEIVEVKGELLVEADAPDPPHVDGQEQPAPGGLVGWSGRVLQPDQLIRQHEPEKDAPITATPHARASIGGR